MIKQHKHKVILKLLLQLLKAQIKLAQDALKVATDAVAAARVEHARSRLRLECNPLMLGVSSQSFELRGNYS